MRFAVLISVLCVFLVGCSKDVRVDLFPLYEEGSEVDQLRKKVARSVAESDRESGATSKQFNDPRRTYPTRGS